MAEALPIEIAPTAAAASKPNVTFFIAKSPFCRRGCHNGFRFKSVQTPASGDNAMQISGPGSLTWVKDQGEAKMKETRDKQKALFKEVQSLQKKWIEKTGKLDSAAGEFAAERRDEIAANVKRMKEERTSILHR
jgi:hypothetical protein